MPAPTYDALIVGAGATGALVARKLAASGSSVVILEAGQRFGGHNELENIEANTYLPQAEQLGVRVISEAFVHRLETAMKKRSGFTFGKRLASNAIMGFLAAAVILSAVIRTDATQAEAPRGNPRVPAKESFAKTHGQLSVEGTKLIDWHDDNADERTDKAVAFFTKMATLY